MSSAYSRFLVFAVFGSAILAIFAWWGIVLLVIALVLLVIEERDLEAQSWALFWKRRDEGRSEAGDPDE